MDADIPVLIMIGSDDSVGGEASVKKLADAYLRVGLSDVEVLIYEGARHEIFNETNQAEVRADLMTWLTSRLLSSTS
jgi:alpha-beta hydrolase superfamily lysophospholipase